MHILLLQNGRLWNSTFSLKLTMEQSCCTALTDYHHKQIMVQLLVCQTLSSCSKVHKCTSYFDSMLKIHFQRCLSHMSFASSNASRWAHCSRKQYTHFLIGLSQSCQHDQRPKTCALQMGVPLALACWSVIPPSNLLLEFSGQSTSNTVFGKIPYQYLELLGKYKLRVHVIFQISKHMKYFLKMSLMWQRQMRGHH